MHDSNHVWAAIFVHLGNMYEFSEYHFRPFRHRIPLLPRGLRCSCRRPAAWGSWSPSCAASATPSPLMRGLLGLLRPPSGCSCSVGPAALSSPPNGVVLCVVSIAVDALLGYWAAFLVLSALPAIVLGAFCRNIFIGLLLRLRVGCVSLWRLRHPMILFVSMSSLAWQRSPLKNTPYVLQ